MKTLKVVKTVLAVVVFAAAVVFLFGTPCLAEVDEAEAYHPPEVNMPPNNVMPAELPASLQDATRANVAIQTAIEENQQAANTDSRCRTGGSLPDNGLIFEPVDWNFLTQKEKDILDAADELNITAVAVQMTITDEKDLLTGYIYTVRDPRPDQPNYRIAILVDRSADWNKINRKVQEIEAYRQIDEVIKEQTALWWGPKFDDLWERFPDACELTLDVVKLKDFDTYSPPRGYFVESYNRVIFFTTDSGDPIGIVNVALVSAFTETLNEDDPFVTQWFEGIKEEAREENGNAYADALRVEVVPERYFDAEYYPNAFRTTHIFEGNYEPSVLIAW